MRRKREEWRKWDAIIRLYYMRKEFTFNKREKVNMFCELHQKTVDKMSLKLTRISKYLISKLFCINHRRVRQCNIAQSRVIKKFSLYFLKFYCEHYIMYTYVSVTVNVCQSNDNSWKLVLSYHTENSGEPTEILRIL